MLKIFGKQNQKLFTVRKHDQLHLLRTLPSEKNYGSVGNKTLSLIFLSF